LASIELRVPLLDESIVAHGLGLASDKLINKRQTKYPLKKILLNILPSRLVERPKTGFNPPLDGLIDKIGKDRIGQELASLNGVLSIAAVTQLVEEHFMKKSNNTYKLWQLLYFSRWVKVNVTK
jgi:asparagine synthase (glutamine-hydrolysing)